MRVLITDTLLQRTRLVDGIQRPSDLVVLILDGHPRRVAIQRDRGWAGFDCQQHVWDPEPGLLGVKVVHCIPAVLHAHGWQG
jgi:hypothetical protein